METYAWQKTHWETMRSYFLNIKRERYDILIKKKKINGKIAFFGQGQPAHFVPLCPRSNPWDRVVVRLWRSPIYIKCQCESCSEWYCLNAWLDNVLRWAATCSLFSSNSFAPANNATIAQWCCWLLLTPRTLARQRMGQTQISSLFVQTRDF